MIKKTFYLFSSYYKCELNWAKYVQLTVEWERRDEDGWNAEEQLIILSPFYYCKKRIRYIKIKLRLVKKLFTKVERLLRLAK